jgi:hypothetical protein
MTRKMILCAADGELVVGETIKNNYSAWGKPLTLDQYFVREQTLKVHSFGNLTCWTLISDDQRKDILAQCETYERPVRLISKGGGVQMVNGFGIASVYTPPEHRRNGYCSTMLEQLPSRIDASVSNLYSDIGPNFYRKLGWNVFAPFDLLVDVSAYQRQKQMESGVCDSILELSDLRDIVRDYDNLLARRADEIIEKDPDAIVSILIPTIECVLWFRTRSEIFARFLRAFQHVDMKQRPFGSKVRVDSSDNEKDFLVYFHDFKDNTLYTLMHKMTSAHSAKLLLDAAVDEAKLCGLKKVSVWNPSPHLRPGLTLDTETLMQPDFENKPQIMGGKFPYDLGNGVTVDLRTEDSLPSLRFTDASQVEGKNQYWLGNEKYGWV